MKKIFSLINNKITFLNFSLNRNLIETNKKFHRNSIYSSTTERIEIISRKCNNSYYITIFIL